ncbi:MAG: hypothetical protein Tsb0019_08870 [Roseibium sp.]
MSRKLVPCLFLVLAFVPAGAAAQQNIDCGYPLTEEERTYCAETALQDARTRMQESYERLRARVVEVDARLPGHLKALEDSQAAWETYADKDCTAYSHPYRDGPHGDEVYRNCLIVLTMKRTEDLESTLQDYSN